MRTSSFCVIDTIRSTNKQLLLVRLPTCIKKIAHSISDVLVCALDQVLQTAITSFHLAMRLSFGEASKDTDASFFAWACSTAETDAPRERQEALIREIDASRKRREAIRFALKTSETDAAPRRQEAMSVIRGINHAVKICDRLLRFFGNNRFFETIMVARNIERIFRMPFWKESSEMLISYSSGSFSAQKKASPVRKCASGFASTVAPQPSFNIPDQLISLIGRFVGAHNLETIWECTECNPYWYGWKCRCCGLVNQSEYWSQKWHFGYCWAADLCGCCRSATIGSGCAACDDVRNLKRTCHVTYEALRTSSGTFD